MSYKYYKIYKPYGTLSQFTKEKDYHNTLADIYDFPPDVYPLGRLDKDSEGLLLLSNDKSLVKRLLDPSKKVKKTYFVQVEKIPSENDLDKLRKGIEIKIKPGKYYLTQPAIVDIIDPPNFEDRIPPIRFRKNIPTQWISIQIHEGKNRQVRKMFAKIGYPVLRLVRTRIGTIKIEGMNAGDIQEIDPQFIGKCLF